MKKAIITTSLCLALAASASALSLSDADYSYTEFGTASTTYTSTASGANFSSIVDNTHQFTMVLVLNWDALEALSLTTNTKIVELFNKNYGNNSKINFGINSSDNGLLMQNTTVKATTASSLDTYEYNGLITMAMTVDGSNVRIGVLNSTGTALGYVGTVSTLSASTDDRGTNEFNSLWLNGITISAVEAVYVFNESVGNRTTGGLLDLAVEANAACAVPEPATATLSMLALAGLAARRRRK